MYTPTPGDSKAICLAGPCLLCAAGSVSLCSAPLVGMFSFFRLSAVLQLTWSSEHEPFPPGASHAQTYYAYLSIGNPCCRSPNGRTGSPSLPHTLFCPKPSQKYVPWGGYDMITRVSRSSLHLCLVETLRMFGLVEPSGLCPVLNRKQAQSPILHSYSIIVHIYTTSKLSFISIKNN